jgi:hypothetical protein
MKIRSTHSQFRRFDIPAAMILGGVYLGVVGPHAIAFAAQPSSAAAPASTVAQQSFGTPQAAVDALISAIKADDQKTLLAIFGPGGERLVVSGDHVADLATGTKFVDEYEQNHSLATQPDGRVILSVGENSWPLPIPLVQSNGKWTFDSPVGAQQIIDRRIGSNELLTIQTLYSCVDAEQDYFERQLQSTGTGEYARHVFSTPGTEDGLYWDVSDGGTPSPLAPLVAVAQSEGYLPADTTVPDSTHPSPYQGYFFRILRRQGPDAANGAKDYIVDGKMTGGFAFVAWPAVYGSTGIMTFIVNQDGVAFQQDLGPDTAAEVAQMSAFDPDLDWAEIVPTN